MKNIIIYSKDYCPYCKAAKVLLDSKGLRYSEIDVDDQPERLKEMVDRSRRRTVPQIFFDRDHIGGYTDLYSYLNGQSSVSSAAS